MIRIRRSIVAVAVVGVVGVGAGAGGVAAAATTLNAKLSGRIEVPKAATGAARHG